MDLKINLFKNLQQNAIPWHGSGWLCKLKVLSTLFILSFITTQALAQSGSGPSQGKNGGKPTSKGVCDISVLSPVLWENGNAGSGDAHLLEGYHLPYRYIMTGLTAGTTYTLQIGFDAKDNGKFALDYVGNYRNYAPHQVFSTGPDPDCANHTSLPADGELVQPWDGTSLAPPFTLNVNKAEATIPEPTYLPSFVRGSTGSWGSSSTALRQFTVFGASSIVANSLAYFLDDGSAEGGALPTLTNATTGSTRMGLKLKFVAAGSTAVAAWGGHIASRFDYGNTGTGASDINGSPYHTRLIVFANATRTQQYAGGSADRSLKAAAVYIPPICTLTGPTKACPNTASLTYTATLDAADFGAVSYTWEIINDATNPANATIQEALTGTSSASSLTVHVIPATSAGFTAGGKFTLHLRVSRAGLVDDCYINSHTAPGDVVVIDNVQVTATAAKGGSSTYSDPLTFSLAETSVANLKAEASLNGTAGNGPFGFTWEALAPYTISGSNVQLAASPFTVVGTIANATTATPTFTATKPVEGLQFRVTATETATPNCAASDPVTINVTGTASCPQMTGPQVICANSQNLTYTATGLAAILPVANTTYTWSIDPSSAASIVGDNVNVGSITVNAGTASFTVRLQITFTNQSITPPAPCDYPVTVNDINPGTIAGSQTLCTPFDPAAFTSTTPGSSTAGGTISYQWQSSTTSAAAGFSNISGANSETYDAPAVSVKTWFRRTATSTLNSVPCSDNSNVLVVTPNDINPGTIAGSQTLCTPFDPAAFTSTTPGSSTAGGTISYQWQSSTTSAAAGFSNISGANSETYDAPAVSVKTWFRRTATSTLNSVPCSDNSNVLVVTPNDINPGTIAGSQTLCTPFDPAAFTSTTPGSSTAGGTISYQWQSSTTSAAAGFSNISGANSETYDAPAVSVKTWFRRTATSTLNSVPCSDNSNVLVVTPNDINPGTIAGSQTLCTPFDPAAFTSTTPGSSTAGGTISYQWQSSTTSAAAGFSNISGANSETYDAPAVSVKTWFRRTATSTLNSVPCSDNSNVLVVTPNDINPGTIAGSQTLCTPFDPAAFTSTTPGSSTAGGTISYQWQSSTTSAAAGFSNISGANSETYDAPAVSVKTWFRRTATSTLNSVPCSDNSNVLVVTPNDINPGTIAGSQTLCTPFDPAAFTSTTPGSSTAGGTISYQWQSSTTSAAAGFSNISGANSETYDAPAVSVKTWFRRTATSTLNSVPCSDNSNVLVVTPNDINPGTIAGSQTLCTPFDPAAFTSTTPGSSTAGGTISYQWQSSTTSAAAGFSNISGANSETYDAPAVSVKTWFRRTATSTLNSVPCSDNSNVLVVTPNDINPGTIAGDQLVCFGDDPAAFTSTTPGSSTAGGTISYQWQSSTTSAAAGFSNISGANSETYDAPVVSVKTWFRRTATSTLNSVPCSDNSNVIAVDLKQCVFPHLFPTQTTCCNYLGGNIANFQLQRACITLSGNKISNATPGVFFYYGTYAATASGSVSIKVDQTPGSGLSPFLPQGTGGGNANVLVDNCQSVPGTVTILAPTTGQGAGDVTFTFTAVAGHTYVVFVKYDMKSIVGKNAPAAPANNTDPWATYSFQMYVNGSSTTYQGSLGQLPLFASGTYGGVTYTCNPNEQSPSGTCPATTVLTRKAPTSGPVQVDDLQVAAYPNPYNSSISFQFVSPLSGKASLEVYDLLGRKLAVVYQGNVDAGKQRTINYKVPSAQHVPMIYKLRVGNKTTFGKLLPGNLE